MDCKELEFSLSRYDELKHAEREAIDLHLSSCDSCFKLRETMKRLDVLLMQEYSNVNATAKFRERIRSQAMSGNTTKLSFLPEIFDFIGWTSCGVIAALVIEQTN